MNQSQIKAKEQLSFIECSQKEVQDLVCVTYGCGDKYNPEDFNPVINTNWIKPDGGLWTSPIDSEWGWKQWCEAEQWNLESFKSVFTIRFKEEAKLIKIDSYADLERLPLHGKPERFMTCIDFQLIAMFYDGVWLTEKGESATRFSRPLSLYGWDCESVLILKKGNIYQPSGSEGTWKIK